MDFSSGLRHHSESHQTHGSVLQRDTHATPPQGIYDVFKKYQKMSDADVNQDLGVIDFCRGLTIEQKVKVRPEDTIAAESIKAASMDFLGCDEPNKEPHHLEGSEGAPCVSYSHTDFPGKFLKEAARTLLPDFTILTVNNRIEIISLTPSARSANCLRGQTSSPGSLHPLPHDKPPHRLSHSISGFFFVVSIHTRQ